MFINFGSYRYGKIFTFQQAAKCPTAEGNQLIIEMTRSHYFWKT